MLNIGDKAQGKSIGKKPYNSWFIYASCDNCGKNRWVPFIKSRGVLKGRNRCKVCSNANRSGYEHASTSREKRWRDYGINLTEQEYDEKFKQQKGRCAICGIPQTELKIRLNVDHNHKTGKVRGLVCPTCNFFIGCIESKDGIIEKAKDYLKSEYSGKS